MKNISLFCITICLYLAGCTPKGEVETAIVKKIKDCEGKECRIKLSELTSFQWDSVYLFTPSASGEDIDTIVGTHYKEYEYKVPGQTILFVKDKKLVHAENLPFSPEDRNYHEVIFGFTDNAAYQIYTPKNAIFLVEIENEVFDYYFLHPLKPNKHKLPSVIQASSSAMDSQY